MVTIDSSYSFGRLLPLSPFDAGACGYNPESPMYYVDCCCLFVTGDGGLAWFTSTPWGGSQHPTITILQVRYLVTVNFIHYILNFIRESTSQYKETNNFLLQVS